MRSPPFSRPAESMREKGLRCDGVDRLAKLSENAYGGDCVVVSPQLNGQSDTAHLRHYLNTIRIARRNESTIIAAIP